MAEKDPRKKYLLMTGTHGYRETPESDETIAVAGDLVPLTPNQYESFKDKFSDPAAERAKAQKILENTEDPNAPPAGNDSKTPTPTPTPPPADGKK